MNKYILYDECSDPAILVAGGLIIKCYICKRIFIFLYIFLPSSKFPENDPYSVPGFLIYI